MTKMKQGLKAMALIAVLVMILLASAQAQVTYERIPTSIWAESLTIRQQNGLQFKGGLNFRLHLAELKGLSKTITQSDLGGFSTLLVEEREKQNPQFLAFSDRNGLWIRFELDLSEGLLQGLRLVAHGVLLDPRTQIGARDIESSAAGAGGMYIAFDEEETLWWLESPLSEPKTIAGFRGFVASRQNGIEAMTRLHDGRLFAIAELQMADKYFVEGGEINRANSRAAWLGHSAERFDRLALATPAGFRPGAAETLADGTVMLVQKAYYPLKRRNGLMLQHIKPSQLAAQSLVVGETLLDVESRSSKQAILDNIEGIGGFIYNNRQYLLLLSDDNLGNGPQQNRLLLFELTQ